MGAAVRERSDTPGIATNGPGCIVILDTGTATNGAGMLEAARKARTLRELRSVCVEVANNDPEAFAELVDLHDQFEQMIRGAAHSLRRNGDYSWADLARPLGVTRSAVQQRYGRP